MNASQRTSSRSSCGSARHGSSSSYLMPRSVRIGYNPVLPADPPPPLAPHPHSWGCVGGVSMMTNIAHTCAPRIKKELSALRHLVIQFDSDSVHLFHIPHGALDGPIKLHLMRNWKWNCKWSWLNMEMTKIKSARLRGTIKISYLWLRWIMLEVVAWFYDLLGSKQCQF